MYSAENISTHDRVTALHKERKIHDIKKHTNIENASQISPIILLGILKPLSHFRMDKEGTNSAHKILNLNWQQGVAFCNDIHSLPFTNNSQRGFYQETLEKEHNIFPFIMV